MKFDVWYFDYDVIWLWVLYVWDRYNNILIVELNFLWLICEKMLILYLFFGLKRNKLVLIIILKYYYVICVICLIYIVF